MESVLSRVQEAFNSAFQIEARRITLETTPGDVEGWDSMGHIVLVNCLETVFHVSFELDDLMAMENVAEIVRIIEAKVGNDAR
jgi:acyl carrier protein